MKRSVFVSSRVLALTALAFVVPACGSSGGGASTTPEVDAGANQSPSTSDAQASSPSSDTASVAGADAPPNTSGVNLGPMAKNGPVPLRSAGPIVFGKDGILFAGDSTAGSVFAIDTQDTTTAPAVDLDVSGLGEKVAAVLGTQASQVLIRDLAVNPISHRAYLSVSRGTTGTAMPALVRIGAGGVLEVLDLASLRYAEAKLPDLPAGGSRSQAITDIVPTAGTLVVAGLSNQEFASSLRTIPFPLDGSAKGTSIEIFHTAHGQLETRAPVRTMVAYDAGGTSTLLAAYTCTPLVRIGIGDLQGQSKLSGATIAELGSRNTPLDMIVYQKGGADFLLIANTSRGVMKAPLAGVATMKAITTEVRNTAGIPYETIATLTGVEQLDALDETRALIIQQQSGARRLRSVPLP
jgi:hypothetical protein